MRIAEAQDGDELVLNLAPLIDVVFLLLVFFMVATTFVEAERELDLALPETEGGAEPAAAPEELVVNVTADGRVVVAGEELSLDALRALLESTARRDPDLPVTVRGDEVARYGAVAAVLGLCQACGLRNTGLMTREAG